MSKGSTTCYPKLWALRQGLESFSFIATLKTDNHNEESKFHKEHFLKYFQDSTFKIQKTKPKLKH